MCNTTYHKHVSPKSLDEQVHTPNKPAKGDSNILKELTNAFNVMGSFLFYKIANEKSLRIGKDEWIGNELSDKLPITLQEELNTINLHFLTNFTITVQHTSLDQACLNNRDMCLTWEASIQWTTFRKQLIKARIKLREEMSLFFREPIPPQEFPR